MVGEIDAATLATELAADEPVRVVDVRSPAAFARGHIPGSENVPFGELTGRIEEFATAERVVTVCPHGEASLQAARLIAAYEGFTGRVDSLEPGLEGWTGAIEAAERGTGDGAASPTAVAAEDGDDDPRNAPF